MSHVYPYKGEKATNKDYNISSINVYTFGEDIVLLPNICLPTEEDNLNNMDVYLHPGLLPSSSGFGDVSVARGKINLVQSRPFPVKGRGKGLGVHLNNNNKL